MADDISLIINVKGKEQLREAAEEFARNARVSAKLAAEYDAVAAKNLKVIKEARRLKALKRDLRREVKLYTDSQGKLGISQHKYTQILKEEIRASKEKVLTDKRLISSAQKKAKAEAQARKETERLRKAYAPARVAKEQYDKAIRDIEGAFKTGIIKQHEYRESLARTKREFAEFTGGVATGGNQFAKFNTEVYKSDQRMKRFASVGLQQAGYQVGDFAVQMQSGTNVAVAFGQQMSQLLGIFGASGAIAGAAVAVSTAFVAPLLEAGKEAENLEEQLQSLVDKLESNKDKTASLIEGGFAGPLERVRQSALSVLETFDKIDQRKAKESFSAGILNITDEIEKQVETVRVAMAGGIDVPFIGPILQNFSRDNLIGQLTRGSAAEEEAAKKVLKELIDLQLMLAKASKGPAEGLAVRATELVEKLEQHGGATEVTLEAYKELLETSGLFETAVSQITKEQEKQQAMAAKRQENEANYIEYSKERHQKEIELQNRRMEHKIKQAKIESDAELDLAIKLYNERTKLEAIQQRQENKLFEIRSKLRRDSISTVYEAEKTGALEAASLQEFILTGRNQTRVQMLRTISAAEQIEAVKQDKIQQKLDDKRQSQENKRFEINSRLRREAIASIYEAERTEILKNADLERFIIVSRNQARVQMLRIIAQAEKEFAEDEEKKRSSLTNIQDTIDALRNQVKQENILLGLTGERLKEEEIFYQLLEANKQADVTLSEKKLRAIAEEIAAQKQANEVIQKGIDFARDLGDVFSDFIMNGFKDFKSFISDIGNLFKRLLAEMVANALATKIFMPITAGFTGAMMGSAAGAATGNMIGAGVGGGAFLAGVGEYAAGISSGFMGVMSGGGLGSSFANLGGLLSGSVGGAGAIGAAIPAVLAIVAVVGLFTKKVKELDSGLRVTVDGTDTLVETFRLLEKSRLFGLIKSKSTEFEAAGAEIADPVTEAVFEIQQQILNAAGALGIGADAFEDFVYQFELSLKGLTEQEQLQKINEEILKMGNNFAALSGHFTNMNDLLATAQQRYALETRLLQAQGNTSALLTREREAERLATHDLNQDVLDQIYAIEDAKIAFNALSNSIQASKDSITADFNQLMSNVSTKISDAEALASQSQSILSMLQSASGRIGMTREAGLDYLRSLRGASRITDEKALGEALSAIGEPSEDLYSSFTDYQREFADQSNLIRELEETAGRQLSHDEQILQQLRVEADAAEAHYNSQIAFYNQQLQDAQDQLNALLGLDESILSVEQAIIQFGAAVDRALDTAAAAAKAAAESAAIKDAAENQSVLGKYGTGAQYKGFDKAELKGAQELLDAANIAGVQTEGKTGAQIQQDISNATGLAIGLDTGTRDDQFALGGYHSGGFRLVGERGPEIEATGPSRVFSANQAKRMMQNPDLVEAVKSMKEEITELRNEQRQLGINNNKYTKRTYDLYRQWDTEGLPAERT